MGCILWMYWPFWFPGHCVCDEKWIILSNIILYINTKWRPVFPPLTVILTACRMTATQKTGPWISVSKAEHSQPVNSTSLAKRPQLLREQNWEMHHLFLFHPVHPVDPRFSYLQKSDERIQLFKKRRALGRTPKNSIKNGMESSKNRDDSNRNLWPSYIQGLFQRHEELRSAGLFHFTMVSPHRIQSPKMAGLWKELAHARPLGTGWRCKPI